MISPKALAFPVAIALLFTISAPAQTSLPREAITAAEIRHHVLFLAGEELSGRWPGSAGLRSATQYAVSQFRAAGLIALSPTKRSPPICSPFPW